MAFDWDDKLLGPVMEIFGEGRSADPSSWPTYYPSSGMSFQLQDAVFDEQYKRVFDLGGGATESTSSPVLGVRDNLFDAPAAIGDTLRIASNGKLYRVVATEPDGHGHTLLILMEATLGVR